MTKSRRVQDQSKKKRIHHLETAVERWKAHSKLQFLIDLIKLQPEQVIRLSHLERHRRLLSLKPPHTVLHFLRKSPNLFDLYSHPSSTTSPSPPNSTPSSPRTPKRRRSAVVADVDGVEHLELVEWRSDWAVTELERRAIERGEYERPDTPGLISLPFPLRFPPNYREEGGEACGVH
ncbi:hypothetical protein QJS10_CPA07g00785 [Acorus calamus]|uniref:PORR domain-containing protein n=1 Tax=Acorus calamus TaxID=4465 RepID=A0AAV9EEG4_ACOCL|nr:hypothetical protein QJS10_CPA07g00785 [Acorus calamus]